MPRCFPLWFLAGLAVTGCATSSPIQRYGKSSSNFSEPPQLILHSYPAGDIYRIYQQAATAFASIQTIRDEVEQRASAFAEHQGKSFVVLGEKISEPPYTLNNFPRIEIVFALIEKAGKERVGRVRADRNDDLERLKKLLDNGTITQEEFDAEKAKVLR